MQLLRGVTDEAQEAWSAQDSDRGESERDCDVELERVRLLPAPRAGPGLAPSSRERAWTEGSDVGLGCRAGWARRLSAAALVGGLALAVVLRGRVVSQLGLDDVGALPSVGLSRVDGGAGAGACHDAADGEDCFESVAWARWHGVFGRPNAYAPCDSRCSDADLQAVIHRLRPDRCPRPCAEVSLPALAAAHGAANATTTSEAPASTTTPEPTPTTTPAPTTATAATTRAPTTTSASSSTSTSARPTTSGTAGGTRRGDGDRRGDARDTASSGGAAAGSSGAISDDQTCGDATDGEECHTAVLWARSTGIWSHPEWYPDLTSESSFAAFQAELHAHKQGTCPRPCKAVNLTRERHVRKKHGPFGGRQSLEFYVYRAQSREDYPLENVNVADLAGVMWYLHNEIIPTRAHDIRKYNITRILRYRLSLKTTWEFFDTHKRQFGGFAAFDKGECTVPNCSQVWDHYGYIVGCQLQQTDTAAYLSDFRTRSGECKEHAEPFCNASVWYSLPGPCPSRRYTDKGAACLRAEPGGRCGRAKGHSDCTYSVEEAGEISLNELSGISDYREFKSKGNQEYIGHLDRGIGNDFWNGKRDAKACSRRLERVKELFSKKYPHLPACDALHEPPCDFDGWYEDEFKWMVKHKPGSSKMVVKKK